MKVDDGLFCKDLCKYDLSGPGCNVDCTGITPEAFDVTPDFCDILCKRGLGKCWVWLTCIVLDINNILIIGYNRCKCENVEKFVKNENVLVCFGFSIFYNVSIKGCPYCPFIDPANHKGIPKPDDIRGFYEKFIVTPEDRRLSDETKKMYCGFACKSNKRVSYCKCGKE